MEEAGSNLANLLESDLLDNDDDEEEGMDLGKGKESCNGESFDIEGQGGEVGSRPSDFGVFNRDITFSDLRGEINLLGPIPLEQDKTGAEWLKLPPVQTFQIDISFKHTLKNLSVFCATQAEVQSNNRIRFKKYANPSEYSSFPCYANLETPIPIWTKTATLFSKKYLKTAKPQSQVFRSAGKVANALKDL